MQGTQIIWKVISKFQKVISKFQKELSDDAYPTAVVLT